MSWRTAILAATLAAGPAATGAQSAPAPELPLVMAPPPARTYMAFFGWDRSDLTEMARQIIAEAAQTFIREQPPRVAVNGYTDLSGGAPYNQALSMRRARSVEAELVRDGVPTSTSSFAATA